MPQMNKGGKSLIRTDGTLRIPPQAMEEYRIYNGSERSAIRKSRKL